MYSIFWSKQMIFLKYIWYYGMPRDILYFQEKLNSYTKMSIKVVFLPAQAFTAPLKPHGPPIHMHQPYSTTVLMNALLSTGPHTWQEGNPASSEVLFFKILLSTIFSTHFWPCLNIYSLLGCDKVLLENFKTLKFPFCKLA